MRLAHPRTGLSRSLRATTGAVGALLVIGGSLAGCGESGSRQDGPTGAPAPSVGASLMTAKGERAGSVSLRPVEDEVEVRVEAAGLEPGLHGFHLHERGVCEADARMEGELMPFSSAGGHVARAGSDHGEHAGDLPPLLAADDGTATAVVRTGRFEVAELLAGDGSAAMIHADPDNAANVPERYVVPGPGRSGGPDADTLETGDSGDRVACGKVEPR